MKRRFHGPLAGFLVAVLATSTKTYERAFSAEHHGPNAALMDTLLTFAGVTVAVLLGMFSLLVALEKRPVFVEMQQGPMFSDLLGRGHRALRLFLVMALACIVGLSMRAGDAWWSRVVVGTTIYALAVAGFIDTYQFADLLVRAIKMKDFSDHDGLDKSHDDDDKHVEQIT